MRLLKPRHLARLGPVGCLAALLALASAPGAAASTTIGQLAPGNSPTATCIASPFDIVEPPATTSGNSYVVPVGGVAITSWSTNAAAGAGQMYEMKVFRLVSGMTYKVVGHDGPHALKPGTVNTFPANLAVQPGDVLGENDVNASAVNNACWFAVTGQPDLETTTPGDLADGMTEDFISHPDRQLNITAMVGFKPSDQFSFGKVKDNKHKGTASLSVSVPGPGTLSLGGKGVKTQRAGGGAVASETVGAAGTVKLPIKAKGKSKRKLKKTGKAKVKVSVTYTPNGTASGDVIGDPKTQTKRVKLVKKR